MLIDSLVLSAVLLVVTNLVARFTRSASAAAGVACLGVLASISCMGLLFSPSFTVNAVLLAVTGFVLAASKARPTTFLPASLAMSVLCYAGVGVYFFVSLQDLKNRYPAESLNDRLAYENTDRHPETSARRRPQPNSEVVTALESGIETEQSNWYNQRRPLALKQLHEKTVEAFVASPGFGVGRGTPNLNRAVELPPIASIRQPSPPDDLSHVPTESRSSVPRDGIGSPIEDFRSVDLPRLHEESLLSFVNFPGFGYVSGRQSIGFQEHHFRALPGQRDARVKPEPLQVNRVELVSLLKHATPRVYLSDNLPRMDELRTAQTRELNDFEARSLPDLVKGEDLVSGRAGDTVFVLGAIRAAKQCLDCHSVERGELLGAFSYRLRSRAVGR